MALTASQIKSYHGKPQEKKIEKSDRDSLSIVVSKKGRVSFYFRFRYGNRQQRMCLGQYPILSLSEAREKVIDLKKLSLSGRDPRIVTEKIKSLTLDLCVDEWMVKRVERQLRPKTQ